MIKDDDDGDDDVDVDGDDDDDDTKDGHAYDGQQEIDGSGGRLKPHRCPWSSQSLLIKSFVKYIKSIVNLSQISNVSLSKLL